MDLDRDFFLNENGKKCVTLKSLLSTIGPGIVLDKRYDRRYLKTTTLKIYLALLNPFTLRFFSF